MPRNGGLLETLQRLVVPPGVMRDAAVEQLGHAEVRCSFGAHLVDELRGGPEQSLGVAIGVLRCRLRRPGGQQTLIRTMGEELSLQREQPRPVRPHRSLLRGEEASGEVGIHPCGVQIAIGEGCLRSGKQHLRPLRRLQVRRPQGFVG